MRLVVFYIYMFFFLLFGGHYLHEINTTNGMSTYSSKVLSKKHHVRFTNSNQNNSVLETTDLDLEDENHGSDDFQGKIFKDICSQNFNALSDWFSVLNQYVVVQDFCKIKDTVYFYGYSCPMYIRQGVLRI